ncbi:MAG: hypothetical protein GX444_07910, partial [Myxococcales bacterium]|nr:hypothetical protein [Myxococcales bacterium]
MRSHLLAVTAFCSLVLLSLFMTGYFFSTSEQDTDSDTQMAAVEPQAGTDILEGRPFWQRWMGALRHFLINSDKGQPPRAAMAPGTINESCYVVFASHYVGRFGIGDAKPNAMRYNLFGAEWGSYGSQPIVLGAKACGGKVLTLPAKVKSAAGDNKTDDDTTIDDDTTPSDDDTGPIDYDTTPSDDDTGPIDDD